MTADLFEVIAEVESLVDVEEGWVATRKGIRAKGGGARLRAGATATILVVLVSVTWASLHARSDRDGSGRQQLLTNSPVHPTSTSAEASVSVDMTLAGGRTFRLTAPGSAGLQSQHPTYFGGIYWPVDSNGAAPCCGRSYEIRFGSASKVFGSALGQAEATTDAAQHPAFIVPHGALTLYPASKVDGDVLAIDVGEWVVLIPEPYPASPSRSMTHAERVFMLDHLRASVGLGGPTVIADAPLTIAGTDAPGVEFGDGGIFVTERGTCRTGITAHTEGQWVVTGPDDADTFSLCDSAIGIEIRIPRSILVTAGADQFRIVAR